MVGKKILWRGVMKNKKMRFVILSAGLLFFHCFGYVYQVSVMEKVIDPEDDKKQIVIGIGDYHDKSHPANSDQREYLEALFKKAKNLKLIVEDLSSINNDGRSMCCNYVINSRGGILGKLADVARTESVEVDNVEYRYCRVAALGPLLNNNQVVSEQRASSSSLLIKVLLQEVLDELERVRHYDDGLFLNGLYNRCVHEVQKSLQQLKMNSYGSITIADYCTRFFKNKHTQELEKMCIFDSPLIDMKIIHSIVSSPEKTIIVVAAGGSHIEKTNAILATLGYKKIITSSSSSIQHHAVESSLGSDKKNKAGVNPPALDMHILDKFID